MGLFDKRDKSKGKKSDDFDSPVEQIDLSAPVAKEPPPPAAPPERTPVRAEAAPKTAPAKPTPSRAFEEDDYDAPAFGIDKAIELMRTLPQDNIELVVQVVKLTLESTRVKIPSIINDATRKQEDIQGRIKVLKAEIADFEQEIAQRKDEIAGLEADYEETSTVKERLELAEKLVSGDSKPRASGSMPAVNRPAGSAAKPPGLGASATSAASATAAKPKTTVVAKK